MTDIRKKALLEYCYAFAAKLKQEQNEETARQDADALIEIAGLVEEQETQLAEHSEALIELAEIIGG